MSIIKNLTALERDELFMQAAYQQALLAQEYDEVPIGAVVVLNDQIIGSGFNRTISQHDPSAHAEIVAIRNAAQTLKNYRLIDCELFVTLEPCLMCAGSFIHARLKRVIFAAGDSRNGALGTQLHINDFTEFNHKITVSSGILKNQCSELLKSFFKAKRQTAKLKS